jgi:hypothetical protein
LQIQENIGGEIPNTKHITTSSDRNLNDIIQEQQLIENGAETKATGEKLLIT